ncbi:MAG: hypothetical protein AB1457_17475, partial [Chloroflexota bacterium]
LSNKRKRFCFAIACDEFLVPSLTLFIVFQKEYSSFAERPLKVKNKETEAVAESSESQSAADTDNIEVQE